MGAGWTYPHEEAVAEDPYAMGEAEAIPGSAPEVASAPPPPAPVPPLTAPVVEFADIADGSLRQLEPAYMRTESISWWIFDACVVLIGFVAILICAAAGAAGWILAVIGAGLVLVAGVLLFASVRMPRLTYRCTSYVVRPEGVEIRQGVFWRKIVSVPRSRVQHTDVIQGPLLRRFGLAALTIHTAGTQEAAVTLAGLAHPTAVRIRDFLVSGDPQGADDGV